MHRYAYMAGLIDGDGCISFKKRHRKSKKDSHLDINISIASKDRIICDIMKEYSGVGWVTSRYHKSTISEGIYYRWEASGKSAWQLLEKLLPYLVLKRPQARLAITLGKRITARKGYKVIGSGFRGLKGSGLTEEELLIRQNMIEQIRAFNHRH